MPLIGQENSAWLFASLCTLALLANMSIGCNNSIIEKEDVNYEISNSDLGNIRRAAIEYLETKLSDQTKMYIDELKSGAVFNDSDGISVGNWNVNKVDEKIKFIRQPPISNYMIYFGLELKQLNKKWKVIDEFETREHLEL